MKKLSDRQVRAVFLDRERSVPEMAELYGVSRTLISQIRTRKQRTSITQELPNYSRMHHVALRSGNYALSPLLARHIYMSKLSIQELADTYRVSVRTIIRILNRQTYRRHTVGL